MASNPVNPNDEIKGLIGWFAQNHVAANLMMAVVICLGLYAIASVKKESFPPFEFDRITVSVPYPGAGPEEVEEGIVVKIILFNLGVEIAIWTVGILILTSKTFSLKGILNPPAVSVIVALVFQSIGGKVFIPSYIWNVIESVAMCSIPIGLMLIGASFYQLMRSFRFSSGFKIEMGAILVRNFLFPMIVLFYVCYGFIPDFLLDIRKVLIVQAAMPAGIFAVVIVGNYSGDKETAMRSIIVTMVVSIITLPLWIMYGIYLLP